MFSIDYVRRVHKNLDIRLILLLKYNISSFLINSNIIDTFVKLRYSGLF